MRASLEHLWLSKGESTERLSLGRDNLGHVCVCIGLCVSAQATAIGPWCCELWGSYDQVLAVGKAEV